TGH
ncbi:yjeF-related family protein, partial [Vibrio parahaemolyticus VPTS-2010_2]